MFERLPMYQNIGRQAIKKDLGNIKKLCEALHNPENQFPSIHIAGTNGKGTVAHLIASVLQSAGMKVGLYTSPHYQDFRERIKVNGHFIQESDVIRFVQTNKILLEEVGPSFFEISVAMAFEHFARQQVDIAIIETGLGGRLDSTNVLIPELSVITNISLDHTDLLGDNVFQIAGEKAGIIKESRPVVIGRYQVDCDAVFMNKATETKSDISFASLNWITHKISQDETRLFNGHTEFRITTSNQSPFFLENVITCVEAITQFAKRVDLQIPKEKVERGIHDVNLLTNYIGRWMILSSQPLMIADSAHNEQAIQVVTDRLKETPTRHLHLVLGFVKDKNVKELLAYFPKDASYYFVKANVVRGMDSEHLAKLALSMDREGKHFSSVALGLDAAKAKAGKDDVIFVGGSSFVVGESLGA